MFTRSLKNMIKNFKTNSDLKNDPSEQFYFYYFSKEAKKLKIDLSHFYYPLTKNKKQGNQTLNSKYFELIFSVEKFTKHFQDYIEQHLFEDYKNEVDLKTESLA